MASIWSVESMSSDEDEEEGVGLFFYGKETIRISRLAGGFRS